MAPEISAAVTRAEINEFIKLPNRLYKGLPGYVEPLLMERRSILDPEKGPFFKHGKVQYWLARRDGQTVGRISAQIDHAQPDTAFDGAGLFGCLDVVDDIEVTAALIQTAERWLAEQGRTRAAGPFVLNINGEPGVLILGHEEPPMTAVPWHPTYLPGHLDALGYESIKDLIYWRLSNIEPKVQTLQARRQPTRPPEGITIRKFDMKNIERDVGLLRQGFNDAWSRNWGYVPLEPADLDAIAVEMKPFMKPDWGIIMHDHDELAAVAMVVPNVFEITADLGAEPSPLGWMKLGWRVMTHTFTSAFVIMLGISSRYRNSVGGAVIAMTMVDEIIDRLLRHEDKSGWLEAGWVLDDNVPLIKILRRQGFEPKRRMRLYAKDLAAA